MPNDNTDTPVQRRPEWLKVKAPGGEKFSNVKALMRSKSLHTVCEEARCPNISECWNCGTATFMILGDTCSRNCGFCAITPGNPLPPDPDEPRHVAESVSNMKLRHVVITSVTRDDLSDGGAEHWAETIKAVKEMNPGVTVEILIPDFKGNAKLVKLVADAGPDIFNHNVETVPNLYSTVRPQANYKISLGVLEAAKSLGMMTKTGFMVGLGEELEQIKNLMKDLRAIDVDILTIGQYLQPTQKHLPVVRYVHPDEFAEYKKIALEMGFRFVESAPLVRSSYHAERSL
jgi:lipoic acid synthetase